MTREPSKSARVPLIATGPNAALDTFVEKAATALGVGKLAKATRKLSGAIAALTVITD